MSTELFGPKAETDRTLIRSKHQAGADLGMTNEGPPAIFGGLVVKCGDSECPVRMHYTKSKT